METDFFPLIEGEQGEAQVEAGF
jgi:hypothetical protein